MKITLKDLLEGEGRESEVVVNDPKVGYIVCQKCTFPTMTGILVVAWDPPSKAFKMQMWCRHCIKESN